MPSTCLKNRAGVKNDNSNITVTSEYLYTTMSSNEIVLD